MINWLQKIAFPFEEYELMHGPEVLDYQEGQEDLDYQEDTYDDLPECPQVLLIVDVQEEFNKCIGFDCQAFLRYLKKCSKHGTEFHIVYDQLGDEPGMFRSLGPTYYAKSYGADPHMGVIDKETGEHLDSSEMEEDVLYHDPEARLDIFWSSGHEYQHVYPDMVELISNIKGKNITVAGGAANECLRDIMHWLNMNNVQYKMSWTFVYG